MNLLYLNCSAGISGDMFLGPSPEGHHYGHMRGALLAVDALEAFD